MAENIDILTEKLENTKIEEAKFEKWNELPPEIKLECIKTMDFITRWSLRSTSRTERALVDSQKLFLNKLQLLRNKPIAVKCSSNLVILPYPYSGFTFTLTEKLLLPLKYILEHGVIETLKIAGRGMSDLEYEKFGGINKPFLVKNFKIEFCENTKEVDFWIKRMSDRLERIEIDKIESMENMIDIPIISNVHFFQINRLDNFENSHQLARNWINNDAEIGRVFQAGVSRAEELALFSSHFKNRIISQTPKIVRICTENPMKHILLELGQILYFTLLYPSKMLLKMSVIPASMKEEETDVADSLDYESDDSFDSWDDGQYNQYENYGEDFDDPYYDSDGYRQW